MDNSDLTLAGPILGLAGVVLTLLWNAWRARRDVLIREARDAASLRMALKVELQQLQADVAGAKTWAETNPAGDIWIPIVDYFSVLKANTQNLGLLTTDEVGALVRAHTSYQREMGNMMRLATRDVVQNPIIGANLFKTLGDPESVRHVVTILDAIQAPVGQAVDVMNAHA